MRVENSFIGVRGVGEATERKLWRAGVTTWAEFDPSVVGPTRGERIRSFIDEGRDRLASGDAGFFADAFPSRSAWRLHESFCDAAAYLDIETTGLDRRRDAVTTVSIHDGDETTTLVRGRDLDAAALDAALADAGLLVTFNGAGFDVPFLRAEFGIDLDVAHLDLRYPCERLGLAGGLDAVERTLGVDRDGPDVSGADAVRLWRAYEAGDDAALDALIEYNREDAAILAPVADRIADALHDEVFPTG